MKANEKEFEENLKRLGELYEEGKDLTGLLLPIPAREVDLKAFGRLRAVLREMRDLAAVQMRHKHDINEN